MSNEVTHDQRPKVVRYPTNTRTKMNYLIRNTWEMFQATAPVPTRERFVLHMTKVFQSHKFTLANGDPQTVSATRALVTSVLGKVRAPKKRKYTRRALVQPITLAPVVFNGTANKPGITLKAILADPSLTSDQKLALANTFLAVTNQ